MIERPIDEGAARAPAAGTQPASGESERLAHAPRFSVTVTIIAFCIFLLSLLWGTVIVNLRAEREAEIGNAMKDTANLARAFDEHTMRLMRETDQLLRFLDTRYRAQDKALDLPGLMKGGAIDGKIYNQISVVGGNGDLLLTARDFQPLNLSDREHFKVHRERDTGQVFISKPLRARTTGEWSLFFSRRINRPDGAFGGIVVAGVNPAYFSQFYADLDLGKRGVVMLVGRDDGIVRARRSGEDVAIGQDLRKARLFTRLISGESGSYLTNQAVVDGVPRIYSYRALKSYPLVVAVGIATDEALAAFNERMRRQVFAAALASLVILGFTTYLLALIARRETMANLLRARNIELISTAEANARLAAIVETTGDAVMSCAPDGIVRSWNTGAEKMLGYAAAEMIGRDVSVIAPPDRKHEMQHHAWLLQHGKSVPPFETIRIASDGRAVDVQMSLSAVTDAGGGLAGIAYILRDVTERKRAEEATRESEERFRATFDQAAVGIAHVAPDGRWLRVNRKLCDIVGYGRDELLQKTFQDITHPDELDADLGQVRRMLGREIDRYSMEKRYFRKSGEVVWINLTVSLLWKPSGEPDYFVSVVEEISERKRAQRELERKSALARLMESLARAANESATPEQALGTCVALICDYGGWTLGRVGTYASGQRLGAPQSSIWHCAQPEHFAAFIEISNHYTYSGRPSGQFVSEALRERRPVWVSDFSTTPGFGRQAAAANCGIRSGFVFPVVVGDDALAFLEFFSGELREPDALFLEAIAVIGSQLARVIERDRAHAERAQLAAIVDSSNDAIISRGPDRMILTWNAAAERMFGWSAAEAIGKSIWLIVPPERRGENDSRRELVHQGIAVPPFDTVRVAKDGRLVDVSMSQSAIRNEKGEIVAVSIIFRDITARKHTDAALRESEHQLRLVTDHVPAMIAYFDKDLRCRYANRSFSELHGVAPDRITGMTRLEIVGEEADKVLRQSQHLTEAGKPVIARRPLRTASGEVRTIDSHRIPDMGPDGTYRGYYTMLRDATLEVLAQEAVEASEARLRAIFDAEPECVKVMAANGTLLDINRAGLEMLEAGSIEQVREHGLLNFVQPEQRAQFSGLLQKTLAGGSATLEFEIAGLGGTHRWMESHATRMILPGSQDAAVLAVTRDVTERRRAGTQRAELVAIVENSNDAIIGRSLDGTITSWNAGAERLFGFAAGEAIDQPITFFLPPGQDAQTSRINERLLRGEAVPRHETRRVTKDGRVVNVMSSISPLRDSAGTVIGASQILQDITERKRAEEQRARLAAIVENSNDAIVSRATDGTILSWNPAAERLFGWSAAEAVGKNISIFIPPGRQEEVKRNMEKLHRGEPVAAYDTVRRRKDGQLFDAALTQSPIKNEHGEVTAVSLIFRDITERKRAETALQESEERFRAAFEQAGVGMGLRALDPRNPRWLRVNEKLCEMLGYTRDELLQLTTVDLTPPEDRGTAIDYNEKLLQGEIESYTREKRYLRKDGSVMWANISLATMRRPDGRPTHVISVIEDITEHKQAEERAGFLAQYDVVTGLPNRRLLNDRLTLALARDKRLGAMTALLLLDLDRFKQVNETLGHGAGDEALQMITARLRECLREVDTIARLEGDEFVVILESVTETAHAQRVAEKIMAAMAEPLALKGEEVFITASIGIALYPADADGVEKLIECAELAMYQAKKEGRNTVQLYTPDRESRRGTGLGMESRLRRALERDELLLHFQPKVDVRTGSITSAEALVRWRNPDLGLVSPADFIPLAEETGLIVPIGEWVLHSACTQASAWRREGHSISVAVNLSARQFRQNELCETVERALADSALEAGRLELEITESMIMHRPEQTIATLQRLHGIGVKLSVDDFGTGYSSLSYLKRFPVHTLKIDQSFVRELHKNADDAAIVRAVIALAASLNLKTVAEGVETEQQLIFLAGLHCDEYQGYYFSKPLPADDFLRLLRERSTASPVSPIRQPAKAAPSRSRLRR